MLYPLRKYDLILLLLSFTIAGVCQDISFNAETPVVNQESRPIITDPLTRNPENLKMVMGKASKNGVTLGSSQLLSEAKNNTYIDNNIWNSQISSSVF